MQFGLVISVLVHAAILGWALITIHSQRELGVPELEPIAVDMMDPSELTKLKQGSRTAKQLEAMAKEAPKVDPAKKEAAKPKPVATAPPPPPPPEPPAPKTDPIAEKLASAEPPPPPPPPAPSAEELKKADDAKRALQRAAEEELALEGLRKAEEKRKADAEQQAEEQRKADERRAEEQRKADDERRAEEQRQAEEKRKQEEIRKQAELKKKADDEKKRKDAAAKKKRDEEKKRLADAEAAKQKQFDADKISALLNKAPNASTPAPSAPPDNPTTAKGPALGAPEGRDSKISASEEAMLKGRISQRLRVCWRLPSAGGGSDTPVVTVRWRLRLDGSLDGDPQVERPRGDPLFRIAAEAAVRAVRECSPFDLPQEKYNAWKTITWDFDPSQMM